MMTAPRAVSAPPTSSSDASPHRRIGDHALDPGSASTRARLELRLHEQHEIGLGPAHAEQRIEDGAQRDEGEVGDDEREGAERRRVDRADVQPFVHLDARGRRGCAGASCPWPTSTATTRAAPACSRQSVKPAGRRAGVEGDGAADVDAESIERAGELLAASAHEARGRREHARSARPRRPAATTCRRARLRPSPARTTTSCCAASRLAANPRRNELGVETPAGLRHALDAAAFLARRLLGGALLRGRLLRRDFFAAVFFAAVFVAVAFFAARRLRGLHRGVDLALELRRDRPSSRSRASRAGRSPPCAPHSPGARCSHGCGRRAPAPAAGSARSAARPRGRGW